MAREYVVQDMVTLPRLNGSSAVALAEQLLTTAEAERGAGLPLLVDRPLARLRLATDILKEELGPVLAAETGIKLGADRVVDRAWHLFSNWVGSLAGTPDGSFPEIEEVRALNRLAFSEGLSFVKLPFREEWTQGENRLRRITEEGYEPLIESLGGAPLLANLKAAHARYGEALGITSPVQVQESPALKAKFLDHIAVMKDYVFKVIALAEPDEPGSEALSTALLVPLTQWVDTPSRPKAVTDAAPSDAAASE